MPYLTQRLGYLDPDRAKELIEKSNKISKMIFGLIQSMKQTKS
jgi:hypothetical protein